MTDEETKETHCSGGSPLNEGLGEVLVARNIAEHIFALGGPDLRGMADDELVAHIKRSIDLMSDAFRKFGVSAQEASKSFEALGQIFKMPNAKLTGRDDDDY